MQVKTSKLSNHIHCIIDIIYMGGLIGREKELRELNYIFNDPKLRSCAVIGRRRIGKTALIKEFIEDRDAIYIQFIRSTPEMNLLKIASVISEWMGS